MKKLSLISIMIVLAVSFFSSCEKENAVPDLTVDVVGKYVGNLTVSETLATKSAIVNVVKSGENEVEIHCYGEIVDTIFVMNLYQNSDSIMVCFSNEEDYYNQYGRHMQSNQNMMHNSNAYSWMKHMDEKHESDDEHFGGFDIKMHTFRYLFSLHSETNRIEMNFVGNKQ